MGLFNFSAFFGVGLLLAVTAHAFSFSVTPAALDSCANITIEWSGGTAPFYLLATPVFGVPRNFSIPESAYTSGSGSYSTQIPFPQGHGFVLTMSDATGFGSGGNSQILTVADASSGSCNTTGPNADFFFDLNTALQQCRQFTFSGYSGAIQPITIMGVIPGGDSFTLSPPTSTDDSYDWTADIWNGTEVIFIIIDSKGRQGGSSDTQTVGISDDSSCINTSSPSSTEPPVASSTGTSSSSSGSTTPVGAIAGTVIGGLIFLAAVISLTLFCLRRRRDRKDPVWIEASGAYSRRSRRNQSIDIDLLAGEQQTSGLQPHALSHSSRSNNTQLQSTSFDLPPSAPFLPSEQSEITPFTAQSEPLSPLSSSTRKAGLSSKATPRFIVHHDAEDVVPEEEEEEVVELPPQYSERRAPPSQSSTSMSGPSSMPFGDRKESNGF